MCTFFGHSNWLFHACLTFDIRLLPCLHIPSHWQTLSTKRLIKRNHQKQSHNLIGNTFFWLAFVLSSGAIFNGFQNFKFLFPVFFNRHCFQRILISWLNQFWLLSTENKFDGKGLNLLTMSEFSFTRVRKGGGVLQIISSVFWCNAAQRRQPTERQENTPFVLSKCVFPVIY